LLRLTNQMVDAMCRNHRWVWISRSRVHFFETFAQRPGVEEEGAHFVPVANATVFFSEVGERLLEMYPEAPFSAYYQDRQDGKRQWGLRSRPGFDCSEVAAAFGGGGHKQAAGFVE
jgi:hypothetical protein